MENLDPAQALATARQNRAELKAQQQRRREREIELQRRTKFERLPSVAALSETTVESVPPLTIQLPTRTYRSIAQNSYLRRRPPRRPPRRERFANIARSRSAPLDLRDQIELDVRLALDSLRSADAQVKAAEEGLEAIRKRAGAGRAPLQGRRHQQRGSDRCADASARARDNRINALYNYNVARIDLGTATGTIQSMIQ